MLPSVSCRLGVARTALCCALVLAAGPVAAGGPHRLSVVAGFYPLAEWAQAVGGDRVTVHNLTPAGGEPHDFEPTPGDLRRLREADVVVTLGAGLQPAVDRALASRASRQVRFVAAEGLAVRRPSPGDDARRDAQDPHVWLDPVLAKAIVLRLAAALAGADPAGREAFEANARAYAERLDALGGRFSRTLATCGHRELVTTHAAFGYLAARYGLTQTSLTGLSPEAEPSPGRLAQIVRFVKARGVTYVFTETLVSPRVARTLARETGAGTLVLNPIEGLTEAELAAGKTYLSVMEENLEALATGLECRIS